MREEGDNKFFMSYTGDEKIFLRVGLEHFVSEELFSSSKEIQKFREGIKPWINAGMIYARWDSFEERFHYSLTREGEEYYKNLNPSNQHSESHYE
jgi:hypothetical protein